MSNRDVVGIFDKSASNEMPLFMIVFKGIPKTHHLG